MCFKKRHFLSLVGVILTFFFISPSSRFCHFFPNISRNKSEIIPSHFILGGEDMIFFKGDYKTNWLVMVVIFCSVVVITSSRPQEQETTTTTFSFFKKKKGTRRLNH